MSTVMTAVPDVLELKLRQKPNGHVERIACVRKYGDVRTERAEFAAFRKDEPQSAARGGFWRTSNCVEKEPRLRIMMNPVKADVEREESARRLKIAETDRAYYMGGSDETIAFVLFWHESERYAMPFFMPTQSMTSRDDFICMMRDYEADQTFFDEESLLVSAWVGRRKRPSPPPSAHECVSTTNAAEDVGASSSTAAVDATASVVDAAKEDAEQARVSSFVPAFDVTSSVRMLMGPKRDFYGRWSQGVSASNAFGEAMPKRLMHAILDLHAVEDGVVFHADLFAAEDWEMALLLVFGENNRYEYAF